MFLSRLTLNAHHPQTRSELARPYEVHRTLSKAWESLEPARVLFRVEQERSDEVSVVVQSLTRPDWGRLDPLTRDYLRGVEGPKELNLEVLKQGQRLRFRLRCNPSERVGDKSDKAVGKRKTLGTPKEITQWLDMKAWQGGFTLREVDFDRVYWQQSKGGIGQENIRGVLFNGLLEVVHPERLRKSVQDGVGPGKAFGFGLLSLAPAYEGR